MADDNITTKKDGDGEGGEDAKPTLDDLLKAADSEGKKKDDLTDDDRENATFVPRSRFNELIKRLKDQESTIAEMQGKIAELSIPPEDQEDEKTTQLRQLLAQAKEELEKEKKERNAATLKLQRAQVASELGIPEFFHDRIKGEDKDAIYLDASLLKEALMKSGMTFATGSMPKGGAVNVGGRNPVDQTMARKRQQPMYREGL